MVNKLNDTQNIVPQPRAGWLGQWDQLIGPGATTEEVVLIWVASLAGVAGIIAYALTYQLAWAWWQIIIAAVLALDIGGGVVANAAAPAKRWYHRAGQGPKEHLTFTALHFIHLALVWLFPDGTAAFVLFWFAYLMLVAVAILRTPLYLQRPVAFLLFGVALVLNQYVVLSPAGLAWLIPLLFLKLLLGHLLHEEAYRP